MAVTKYSQSQLMNEEQINFAAETHWVVYLRPALITAGSLVLLTVSSFGLLTLLGALIDLLSAYIRRQTTELAITTWRVIAKFGFIKRVTFEMDLRQVEGVNLVQSILGRVLGYGSVVVRGTGGGQSPIPCIADPERFKRTLDNQVA